MSIKSFLHQGESNYSTLPDALKKSVDFVKNATNNGNNLAQYNQSETIKRVIDTAIIKMNEFVSKQKTAQKTSVKKIVAKPTITTKTKQTKKTKSVTKEKPKSKPIAEHNVSELPEEIKIIKRFVNFVGKIQDKKAVATFLDYVQKAIVNKKVRKTSQYSDEIIYIQKTLVALQNDGASQMQVSWKDAKQQTHYKKIVDSYNVMASSKLLKNFVSIDSKNDKEKAAKLLNTINKKAAKDAFSKGDEYKKQLTTAKENINKFVSGKSKKIEATEQPLNGPMFDKFKNNVKKHGKILIDKTKKGVKKYGKIAIKKTQAGAKKYGKIALEKTKQGAKKAIKELNNKVNKESNNKAQNTGIKLKAGMVLVDNYGKCELIKNLGKKGARNQNVWKVKLTDLNGGSPSIDEKYESEIMSDYGGLNGLFPAVAGAVIGKGIEKLLTNNTNNLKGVLTVGEIKDQKFDLIRQHDKWTKLFGKVCTPTSVLFYGKGGSKKTTAALRYAEDLNLNGYKVLYVAAEEFGTPTLQYMLERLKLNVIDKTFKIVGSLDTLPVTDFDVVVLDSKDTVGFVNSSDFEKFKLAHPKQNFILIAKATKGGDFRGDEGWRNVIDIMCQMDNGVAKTGHDKNRWGGAGELVIE